MNCRFLMLAALLTAWFAATSPAQAHKPSDSYLTLKVDGEQIAGQWDIALRDLDFAIGLDANQDDAITWGEVKAKHADIAAYALARLRLGPESAPCPAQVTEQLIDNHSDGAYAVLRFTATCAAAPKTLTVAYKLFFDLDPQHRGLIRIDYMGANRAGILGVDHAEQKFTLAELSRWQQFLDYGREGVWHIWTGFDHILFLLSLLLPAVLVRSRLPGQRWEPAGSFRATLVDVVKVVTAFTFAHSLTLSLAALGVVTLPSRLVESAIALSVVLAALNNLWPVVFERRWVIAFCFGLIHGFGFASVLADLGLPQESLLLALVAFNVGVELGQLAIVAVFLPIAYNLRRTALYQRGIFVFGSAAIALVALVWLIQRAFNLRLIGG
ncbi:MAG: HupE/UreJ family protein [Casimicrobiaceae bacterium]